MHELISRVAEHWMDATAAGSAMAGVVAIYVRHSIEGGSLRASARGRLLLLALLSFALASETTGIALEFASHVLGVH